MNQSAAGGRFWRRLRDSANPARIGRGHGHRLKPRIAADRLVGPHLVQTLPFGVPLPLAELKNRSGQPLCLKQFKRPGLEVNAYQGQQAPSLPVPRPENLVVPLGRFPPLSFGRIDVAERRDKPGLEPFPALME